MSDEAPNDQNTTFLPDFCPVHRRDVVARLTIPENGPWAVTIVVANIFLFQAATENPVVWDRCTRLPDGTRDARDLSLVLGEIGCLACFQPEKFEKVIALIRIKGLEKAAQITRTNPLTRPDDERI